MRIAYLATLGAALCLAGTMQAQSCGAVSDEAGVINQQIKANSLIDQGADVHVVTVKSLAPYGHRLIDVERAYEKYCPNWVEANGQRKSNLIVIMVAPNDRLKNIFLGSTYDGLFSGEDAVNQLYAQAANGDFRKKNWVDGINATAAAIADKLIDRKNPAASPASKMTFFVVLLIIGIATGLILLFAWIIPAYTKKKRERERTEAMQQKAIQARNEATDAFTALPKDHSYYPTASVKYLTMSNTIAIDPTTDGLSADSYESIADQWNRFTDSINRATRPASSSASTPPPSPAPISSK